MTVFISYSHADKDTVDRLATKLVAKNASVWVDRWELSVGDSIINKVQDAIEGSDALLVVLSKASLESEWCKKELTTGLFRELEERRVVVLPVLIDDCKIPLFLKEKKYADLRKDFDGGVQEIVDSIAKVTNANQGRLSDGNGFTDFACDWGYIDSQFFLRYTVVNCPGNIPMTVLTEVLFICTDELTQHYRKYEALGIDWMGRVMLAEHLFDLGDKNDLRVILENQFEVTRKIKQIDPKNGRGAEIIIKCRKLGQDNGKDQLVPIGDCLKSIRGYMRHVARRPSQEDLHKMALITMSG